MNLAQRSLPWGYGTDVVAAMPVDPDNLYCCWENTDAAMEGARKALGDGGTTATLALRVHDVTGRIFDGTNAHSSFDHVIGRNDRQWFFVIAKPTSEVIVDVGLRTESGAFARIARSRRVVFPRRNPLPPSPPEWLTVRASGAVEPVVPQAPAHPGQALPSLRARAVRTGVGDGTRWIVEQSRVLVRALGRRQARRLLAQWELHGTRENTATFTSAQLIAGASEWRLQGAGDVDVGLGQGGSEGRFAPMLPTPG